MPYYEAANEKNADIILNKMAKDNHIHNISILMKGTIVIYSSIETHSQYTATPAPKRRVSENAYNPVESRSTL